MKVHMNKASFSVWLLGDQTYTIALTWLFAASQRTMLADLSLAGQTNACSCKHKGCPGSGRECGEASDWQSAPWHKIQSTKQWPSTQGQSAGNVERQIAQDARGFTTKAAMHFWPWPDESLLLDRNRKTSLNQSVVADQHSPW